MKRSPFVFLGIVTGYLLVLSGCSPTVRNAIPGRTGAEDTYEYYAVTDNCNCEEFHVRDPAHPIEYRFKANYSIDPAIITNIEIEIQNNSGETVHLDPGVVKIASKNVSYEYNDKFLPLPQINIPPHKSDRLSLTGQDLHVTSKEWNKIAGERLTVTMKGMRIGKKILTEQSVSFVPKNPQLKGN